MRTAERDVRSAQPAIAIEPSLAAFHAQQGAEKALKGRPVALTDDHERTHTAGRLARDVRTVDATIPASVERDASALARYYLTARYPDTIGDVGPGDVISEEDATRAVARPERILTFVHEPLGDAGASG